MTLGPVPLSVLDFSPVGPGSTPAEALLGSTELAREAERLGYRRYWVAEHHGIGGIASSSPAVLIAHLASSTSTIRVGSGGVMLPNHAPLVVAEQFGMLEALHPDRVDLGIGRAPGTDELTARALRRSAAPLSDDDFPGHLKELIWFFTGSFPAEHPYHGISAVPGLGNRPAIWLLGSSTYSAQCAGLLGLPFSFAYHFAAPNTEPAIAAYRNRFRAVGELERPYVMVAVSVVCAETDERALTLALPSGLAFLRVRAGRCGPLPSVEEAQRYPYTPAERETIRQWTASQVVGSPETVKRQLGELVQRTGADELMITTLLYGQDERLQSYRLLAGGD
ncbi:MAG: LLM class flavin-dependent oxidoreductase [Acidimicrobiia bacterium]